MDDKVWIIKTHYPDGFSVELDFSTNKIALCVRNPLDVLASQFSFLFTWTHSKNIKQAFHTEYKETWDKLVRYQIHKWASFHRWWLDYSRQTGVPIYFFRYEDIISSRPDHVLREFFAFALD